MSDPRARRLQAMVLRVVPYAEADLIVTFLTAEEGKVGAFGKGARRSKRRFSGGLEPFRLLQVEYRERSGSSLARLLDTQVVEAFDSFASDLHSLTWASTVLGWTDLALVEGEPTDLFDTLLRFLRWLSRSPPSAVHVEVAAFRFGLLLLAHTGFLPALNRCARTGQSLESLEQPYFSVTAGGCLSSSAIRPDDASEPVERRVLEFLTLVAQGRFPPKDTALEIHREARRLVFALLLAKFEKEPRALSLLRTLWL